MCTHAVVFTGVGMGLVQLEARPVAARFAGFGQVNEVPGEWAPAWEAVEVGG